MDVRGLSNVIWGMGKIKLKLEDEPIGHHLAAEVEARVLELMQRGGIRDSRDAGQLWLGLAESQYSWSKDFLKKTFEETLSAAPEWSLAALSMTVTHVYPLQERGVSLSAGERTRLRDLIEAAVATEEQNVDELMRSSPALVRAADKFQLALQPATLAVLHDAVLSSPPFQVMTQLGRSTCARLLFRFTSLGVQLTPDQANAWGELLLQNFGESWSAEEVAKTAGALARCRNYMPPEELKQRVRWVLETQGSRLKPYKRYLLVAACKAWGLPVPLTVQAAAGRVERTAPPGGRPPHALSGKKKR